MSDFKPWYKSKTVQQAIVALVAAIIGLVSAFLGWGVETETMVISAVSSLLAAVFRVTAKQQVGSPDPKPDTGRIRNVSLALLVLMTLLLSSGCTRFVKGDKLSMDVKKGPPCQVKVYMDGELIQESTAEKQCVIREVTP